MAKLEDFTIDKKKNYEETAYYSIFGDIELGKLITAVHSTSIKNGTELENIIYNLISIEKPECNNLKELLELISEGEDFYLGKFSITKEELQQKNLPLNGRKKIQVDGILFKNSVLYIIEYKDGDALDTGKSQNVMETLTKSRKLIEEYGVKCASKLVLWRSSDLKTSSIKTTEHRDYLITGRDMADLLGIDFEDVKEQKSRDQQDNIEYFFQRIDEIRSNL